MYQSPSFSLRWIVLVTWPDPDVTSPRYCSMCTQYVKNLGKSKRHVQLHNEKIVYITFFFFSWVCQFSSIILSSFLGRDCRSTWLSLELNSHSFEFLHISQTLVITDDVVKIYRNYVILYTLQDVISELLMCL